MKTVNIREAKAHLSRLVDEASEGEPFVITKAGRPIVKLDAIDAPAKPAPRRLNFLSGQISVPDDFDAMGRREIEQLPAVPSFGQLLMSAPLSKGDLPPRNRTRLRRVKL